MSLADVIRTYQDGMIVLEGEHTGPMLTGDITGVRQLEGAKVEVELRGFALLTAPTGPFPVRLEVTGPRVVLKEGEWEPVAMDRRGILLMDARSEAGFTRAFLCHPGIDPRSWMEDDVTTL